MFSCFNFGKTLYLITHSLISATANFEDIGLTIDEKFGPILIRL